MRYLLTSIVTFHWTAVFGMLAMVAILDGDGGLGAILSTMGVGYSEAVEHAPSLSALLALGSTVVSVLFFWAFVTCAFALESDDGGAVEVLRLAFAGATLFLTLVVLVGAAQDVSGLFPAATAFLGALLVSYLAVFAERWSAALTTAPGQDDVRAAARVMALGAAHSTLLARLSGRTGAQLGDRS